MQGFFKFKQHAIRYSFGAFIMALLLLHVSGWMPIPFIERLEQDSYDARLKLLLPGGVDTRVVIVDIDEKSLSEQGRWPWGRDKLAALVDQLFEHYQINTLGFDVVFAESDDSSGYKALTQLQQQHFQGNVAFLEVLAKIRPKLDYDQRFADSLTGRRVVLGYYFSNQAIERSGALPPPILAPSAFQEKPVQTLRYVGFGANLPSLQQQAIAAGHFNPVVDSDGIARKISMLSEYEGGYYESLALATARVALGVAAIRPGFAQRGVSKRYAGLEWLEVGQQRIPVDRHAAALIPYRGVQGSFPYVSATDVLNGRVNPTMLHNKIALVGK